MNLKAPSPRQKRDDLVIVKLIAEAMAPKLATWCGNGTTPEQVIPDLVQALRFRDDGYEVCKNLASYGPDSELVEIMDDVGMVRRRVLEKAHRDWVRAYQLEGPPLGSKVAFVHSRHGRLEGEVTRNDADGRSLICCESLGRVKDPGALGTHGFVIEWENLEFLALPQTVVMATPPATQTPREDLVLQ